MLRRHAAWILPVLLMSACQGHSLPVGTAVKVARKAAAYQVKPAVQMLQATPNAVKVAGTIQLDAAYAVKNAGGALLTMGGSTVTAPDGGKVQGSTIVSNDGSTIIAQGGGNVIADSALIGQDASSLIGNDGSSVIAHDGGGIVSNDGSTFTTGAGFHLASVSSLAAGTVTGAVGMVVQVRNLVDDSRVAIGVDAQGKPVYSVYSDAQGKFQLYLARTVAQNVRVIVTPRTKTDPKLRYESIGMSNAPATVDEDTTVVFGYILNSVAGRLAQLMRTAPEDADVKNAPLFKDFDAQIAAASQDGGLKAASDATRNALALKLAKLILGPIDLSKATYSDQNDNSQPCLSTVTKIVGVTRENMAKRMVALEGQGTNPTTFFAGQAWMAPGKTLGLAIDKPSDFVDFIVKTQLENLSYSELQRFQNVHQIVIDAGLPTDDQRMLDLAAASNGLLDYIDGQLKGAPAITKQVLGQLRAGGK